jgi:hypothetical protein
MIRWVFIRGFVNRWNFSHESFGMKKACPESFVKGATSDVMHQKFGRICFFVVVAAVQPCGNSKNFVQSPSTVFVQSSDSYIDSHKRNNNTCGNILATKPGTHRRHQGSNLKMRKCVHCLLLLVFMTGSVVDAFPDHREKIESFIMSVIASHRGVANVVDFQNSAHGRRRLSGPHPTEKHLDDAAISENSSGTDSDSKSGSSPATVTDPKPTGSIASRTSRLGSTKKSRSSDSAVTTTSSTTTSNSTSSSSLTLSMGTISSKDKSTTTVQPQSTDPGEQAYYDRAFPTVYKYTDDDSWNSNGYNMHRPLNPAVDDILQFLDDDSYKNTNRRFPKEQDVPAIWPLVCIGILITTTAVLCATTAYKNYRKRKNYQQIPTSLNV